MNRRAFVAGLGAVLAAPVGAEAQQTGKVRRIGILLTTVAAEHPQHELSDAFRQGLRELGYLEGRNVLIEYRATQGSAERLRDLFAELARFNVDLILVVGGTPAARAAQQANVMIPVIAPAMGDPLATEWSPALHIPEGISLDRPFSALRWFRNA